MYFIYFYIEAPYTYSLIYVYYSMYVLVGSEQDPVVLLGQPRGSAQHRPPQATWPAEVEIQDKMPTGEERVWGQEGNKKLCISFVTLAPRGSIFLYLYTWFVKLYWGATILQNGIFLLVW